MAKNTQLAYATCNAQANTIGGLCNDGYIRIYDGSQPANADTAITTQNLLATLRFASTAFGSPSNGVITAAAIASVTASASGTASWYRAFKSDGTTVVMDGNVATSNANMVVPTTSIVSGLTVSVTSLTHTVPRA